MAVSGTALRVEDVFHPKEIGQDFERLLARTHPVGLVPDEVAEWYDAVATTAIHPAGDLPFFGICVVERGAVLELKMAQKWTPNGSGRSRGRWLFKRSAHEKLVDAGGVYLLGVHQPGDRRGEYDLVRQAVVPASLLDEHLKGRWYDGPDGRSEGEIAQLAWNHVLQPEVGEGGD